MITLSSVITQFEADFLKTYQKQVLPSQLKALSVLKICRTQRSPIMQLNCTGCEHQTFVPHSCGHRHCPHCQHHDKSAGKLICTALAALRVKVHGCTFMIVSNGLNDKCKNRCQPGILC